MGHLDEKCIGPACLLLLHHTAHLIELLRLLIDFGMPGLSAQDYPLRSMAAVAAAFPFFARHISCGALQSWDGVVGYPKAKQPRLRIWDPNKQSNDIPSSTANCTPTEALLGSRRGSCVVTCALVESLGPRASAPGKPRICALA